MNLLEFWSEMAMFDCLGWCQVHHEKQYGWNHKMLSAWVCRLQSGQHSHCIRAIMNHMLTFLTNDADHEQTGFLFRTLFLRKLLDNVRFYPTTIKDKSPRSLAKKGDGFLLDQTPSNPSCRVSWNHEHGFCYFCLPPGWILLASRHMGRMLPRPPLSLCMEDRKWP